MCDSQGDDVPLFSEDDNNEASPVLAQRSKTRNDESATPLLSRSRDSLASLPLFRSQMSSSANDEAAMGGAVPQSDDDSDDDLADLNKLIGFGLQNVPDEGKSRRAGAATTAAAGEDSGAVPPQREPQKQPPLQQQQQQQQTQNQQPSWTFPPLYTTHTLYSMIGYALWHGGDNAMALAELETLHAFLSLPVASQLLLVKLLLRQRSALSEREMLRSYGGWIQSMDAAAEYRRAQRAMAASDRNPFAVNDADDDDGDLDLDLDDSAGDEDKKAARIAAESALHANTNADTALRAALQSAVDAGLLVSWDAERIMGNINQVLQEQQQQQQQRAAHEYARFDETADAPGLSTQVFMNGGGLQRGGAAAEATAPPAAAQLKNYFTKAHRFVSELCTAEQLRYMLRACGALRGTAQEQMRLIQQTQHEILHSQITQARLGEYNDAVAALRRQHAAEEEAAALARQQQQQHNDALDDEDSVMMMMMVPSGSNSNARTADDGTDNQATMPSTAAKGKTKPSAAAKKPASKGKRNAGAKKASKRKRAHGAADDGDDDAENDRDRNNDDDDLQEDSGSDHGGDAGGGGGFKYSDEKLTKHALVERLLCNFECVYSSGTWQRSVGAVFLLAPRLRQAVRAASEVFQMVCGSETLSDALVDGAVKSMHSSSFAAGAGFGFDAATAEPPSSCSGSAFPSAHEARRGAGGGPGGSSLTNSATDAPVLVVPFEVLLNHLLRSRKEGTAMDSAQSSSTDFAAHSTSFVTASMPLIPQMPAFSFEDPLAHRRWRRQQRQGAVSANQARIPPVLSAITLLPLRLWSTPLHGALCREALLFNGWLFECVSGGGGGLLSGVADRVRPGGKHVLTASQEEQRAGVDALLQSALLLIGARVAQSRKLQSHVVLTAPQRRLMQFVCEYAAEEKQRLRGVILRGDEQQQQPQPFQASNGAGSSPMIEEQLSIDVDASDDGFAVVAAAAAQATGGGDEMQATATAAHRVYDFFSAFPTARINVESLLLTSSPADDGEVRAYLRRATGGQHAQLNQLLGTGARHAHLASFLPQWQWLLCAVQLAALFERRGMYERAVTCYDELVLGRDGIVTLRMSRLLPATTSTTAGAASRVTGGGGGINGRSDGAVIDDVADAVVFPADASQFTDDHDVAACNDLLATSSGGGVRRARADNNNNEDDQHHGSSGGAIPAPFVPANRFAFCPRKRGEWHHRVLVDLNHLGRKGEALLHAECLLGLIPVDYADLQAAAGNSAEAKRAARHRELNALFVAGRGGDNDNGDAQHDGGDAAANPHLKQLFLSAEARQHRVESMRRLPFGPVVERCCWLRGFDRLAIERSLKQLHRPPRRLHAPPEQMLLTTRLRQPPVVHVYSRKDIDRSLMRFLKKSNASTTSAFKTSGGAGPNGRSCWDAGLSVEMAALASYQKRLLAPLADGAAAAAAAAAPAAANGGAAPAAAAATSQRMRRLQGEWHGAHCEGGWIRLVVCALLERATTLPFDPWEVPQPSLLPSSAAMPAASPPRRVPKQSNIATAPAAPLPSCCISPLQLRARSMAEQALQQQEDHRRQKQREQRQMQQRTENLAGTTTRQQQRQQERQQQERAAAAAVDEELYHDAQLGDRTVLLTPFDVRPRDARDAFGIFYRRRRAHIDAVLSQVEHGMSPAELADEVQRFVDKRRGELWRQCKTNDAASDAAKPAKMQRGTTATEPNRGAAAAAARAEAADSNRVGLLGFMPLSSSSSSKPAPKRAVLSDAEMRELLDPRVVHPAIHILRAMPATKPICDLVRALVQQSHPSGVDLRFGGFPDLVLWFQPDSATQHQHQMQTAPEQRDDDLAGDTEDAAVDVDSLFAAGAASKRVAVGNGGGAAAAMMATASTQQHQRNSAINNKRRNKADDNGAIAARYSQQTRAQVAEMYRERERVRQQIRQTEDQQRAVALRFSAAHQEADRAHWDAQLRRRLRELRRAAYDLGTRDPIDAGAAHVLLVEVKSPTDSLSGKQIVVNDLLLSLGIAVHVCRVVEAQ